MKGACCVCLAEVDNQKTIRNCRVCNDTLVCGECFDVMRETNIHQRCPVCRSDNWSPGSDEVLIITDVNPFTDTENPDTLSVSINIMLNRTQDNTENVVEAPSLWKLRAKVAIRAIAATTAIWSVGFIALSIIYDDNFYQDALYYVIFGSIIAGLVVSVLVINLYILMSV